MSELMKITDEGERQKKKQRQKDTKKKAQVIVKKWEQNGFVACLS